MNVISTSLKKTILQIANDWRSHDQNHIHSLVRNCGNPVGTINPQNITAVEVNHSRANFYQLVHAIM